ncbi:UPF0462 protein C4orf33 homolog isoform X1 [Heliangelus exortis]|uniref:UPF0462 protein C4orf33 homolog isoform X1 n=2 Tax=Heliangelus exortis TaxID=472823 RepID=UPI003A8D0DE4
MKSRLLQPLATPGVSLRWQRAERRARGWAETAGARGPAPLTQRFTFLSCTKMEFAIKHTWDGLPVSHEPVRIVLKPDNSGLIMEVSAPFFNDPPAPLGEPGKPFNRLWDYEVVEAFFLSDRTEQYLEVELCPHGQHLLLLLSSKRKVWKDELPLNFEVTRMNTKWEGKAHLPWNYFPPCTNKFNAFAIHGSGEERKYEALHPVPPQEGQQPDFHRLEFFKYLNLKGLMGEDWKQPESDLWKSLTH